MVLYGYETWPLTLREEHKLRVFENRVLRRIFGLKRDEVTGGWREPNSYRILVGKPEGKRPLGRPRREWVGNIKMDVREIGCGGMEWIDLSQNRGQWRALVNTLMNLRVP
jgi:hypothetical protein